MCAGEKLGRNEVLQLLSHLVDKLLVLVTEQDGEARYRLLETVRQYGWEKLSESGEAGKFRERHARYYLALAEEAEPELKGKRQVAWLERFERDHDNLRAAMAFLLKRGELEEAARLGWALWLFWGYALTSPRDGGRWSRCYRRRVASPCRRPPGLRLCTSRA